jgi:probable rRNA maturation factor
MSLDVDVSTNGLRIPVSRDALADAARTVLRGERVHHALLSVTMLGRSAMARMNKTHLEHTGPTDVISFGFARPSENDPVIGDIYICPDVARANARARGVPVREELLRITVHGTLHVLGYDHPDITGREQSEMWRVQERALRRILSRPRR